VKAEHNILLSLGSNLGNKYDVLNLAVQCLSLGGVIHDCKVSSFYETEPFGVAEQDWFVNIALCAKTHHTPLELLFLCKSMEYLLGRKPRERWHEREIDIDLIFFDDIILQSDVLTIPHIMMHLRNFVLAPAAEIAPGWIHPLFGESVSALLDKCPDKSIIRKVK
jgi:2-amino-4-hydroxy-6-hydroxymethyldihydropteridine diphosphokinase